MRGFLLVYAIDPQRRITLLAYPSATSWLYLAARTCPPMSSNHCRVSAVMSA